MTSQKDQIQALITDIDGVLQKTTPRLPWVVSGEITQQRQVLERVRNYLVAFQRRQIAGEGFEQAGARPDLLAHDIYYQPSQSTYASPQVSQSGQQAYGQNEVNAQQMLQAIVQEMGYLRSNLMQPLQADLEVLRQQRETLLHEIRQLEAQRQGYAGQLPGQQQLIAEFLQALMSRLQETLPQQVAQSLSRNQQSLPYANASAHDLALAGSAPAVIATSAASPQGLSNIQVSQAPSDELLIRLDSTLSIVFESLQRNVQAYQESLSQGLDKMHSMGQQGEMMFTALISHLAQQLGRETSSYLQPSTPTAQEAVQRSPSLSEMSTSSVLPTTPPLMPSVNPLVPTFSQPSAAPFTLPFPGTEVADHFADAGIAPSPNVPMPSVDTAIDSWLRSAGSIDATPDVDLEIAALNLEGFDLSQLAAQDVNALLELDATLIGTNLPSQPLLAPTAPTVAPADVLLSDVTTAPTTTAEDTADIDAALKLLEQLSSELQNQPSSVADADAQIDRMLSSPTALEDASTAGIPDDARDELDEFYESLFGTDAVSADTIAASAQSAPPLTRVTDTEPQTAFTPAVELEPVIESVEPAPAIAPESLLAIQPADTQPISTLPAETPVPTGALAEPTAPPAPSVAAIADPTLGWHLATEPAVTQFVVEEIPAALLEDELVDGWDFADDEIDLAEPATISTSDDLLGGWDLAADDHTSLPVNAPSSPALAEPATISTSDDLLGGWDLTADDRTSLPVNAPSPSATEPLTAFDESQAATTDSPASAPSNATLASDQNETSQDEISSLADLFGEPEFGETELAETVPTDEPLKPAIANAPALPVLPNQSPINLPARSTEGSLPTASPTQTPSVHLTDGYLTDDRYTPASPDEDLLSLDEPVEALDSELWLDESTLNRLSEDLFNLEEATSESATLPYEHEDTGAQALFTDAAGLSEAAPTASETTLDDWRNDSLSDFGSPTADSIKALDDAPIAEVAPIPPPDPAPFPLESESDAIAIDPPGVFILEGMDDLFANTPLAPPVTPISPPVPPATELPASFTLEGMDDLFADALAGDRALPDVSTPAAAPPFTLEGADDLFADAVTSTGSLPTVSAPAAEVPFTLEGVDELFADESSSGSLPAASVAADQSLPFTLEGVDELFADLPPTIVPPPGLDVSPVVLPVADSPPTEPGITSSTAASQTEPAPAFTLEQVGDLFVELPAAETSAPIAPVGFAHDGSSTAAITSAPDLQESTAPPFTLEQVGDLFIEVPSEEPTLDARPIATTVPLEPAPFSLEPVSALTDTPTPPLVEPVAAPLLTPPEPPEPSALEQAFASLMGSFDEPLDASPSVADTIEATAQAPEKKKEMS